MSTSCGGPSGAGLKMGSPKRAASELSVICTRRVRDVEEDKLPEKFRVNHRQ